MIHDSIKQPAHSHFFQHILITSNERNITSRDQEIQSITREGSVMPEEIQLHSREKFHSDIKKSDDGELPPLHLNFNPATNSLRRKIYSSLVIEILLSVIVYLKYDYLLNIHPLFAPGLLGATTAALAQSMNQYFKFKFSVNKILKFVVWGIVNGCLTVLWIDMLRVQFESSLYRIVVDQLVGAPAFQMIYNILSVIWESGDFASILLAGHLRSLKYSYCFWPFFSICAFVLLPPAAFFPANCLANLVWNLILSKLS